MRHPAPSRPLRVLLALIVLGAIGSAEAAPKKKKVTDPLERKTADKGPVIVSLKEAAADPNFRFVGEYEGTAQVTASSRSIVPMSLHINSTGENRLTGLLLHGRLPGHPDAAETTSRLTGRRFGSQAALAGEELDVVLKEDPSGLIAEVRTPEGEMRGTLRKVERDSPTLGQVPPPGAIRLFDGTTAERFKGGRLTPEGWLAAGTETADAWDNFRLHIEFRLPYKPNAAGQARGNSGVYIQSRYELQVLDSFGFDPAFNDIGSLYRTKRPERIATRPPLQWQTYDIDFRSPRFDAAGDKIVSGRLRVWHNGVLIHSGIAIPNKTGAGKPEAPFPLPTKLQDHKNPVVFRNIWLLPDGATDAFGPPAAVTVPPSPVAVPLTLR